jgi:hypothetical protein
MLYIKTLRCRVSVKQKEKSQPTGKGAGPSKPTYLLTTPQPTAAGAGPPPSQTATDSKGSGIGEKRAVSSQGADPMKVAEKVYQLMFEEARDAKRRGMN